MSDERKPIAVCPHCATPLVWTFTFSRAEWYCATCKRAMPMFDADERPWSVELAATAERLEAEFCAIAKHCIAVGERRRDCPQCEAGEDHLQHATAEACAASTIAYAKLRGM